MPRFFSILFFLFILVIGAPLVVRAQTDHVVANLWEARQLGAGAGTVLITGQVVVTAGTNSLSGFDNQLFVQDNSGPDGQTGLLIDDNPFVLGRVYEAGDVINNISGELTAFRGMLQLQPQQNTVQLLRSEEPPAPLVRDASVTDFEMIEGELVELQGILLAEVGFWQEQTLYELLAPTDVVIDSIWIEENSVLVGEPIPSDTFDLAGLASQFDNKFELLPAPSAGQEQTPIPTPTPQPTPEPTPEPGFNDDFQNALPMEGPFGNDISENFLATKEPGEPDHAGNSGGASLWWSWEAAELQLMRPTPTTVGRGSPRTVPVHGSPPGPSAT